MIVTQWTWMTQAFQSVMCKTEAPGARPASSAPQFPFMRLLAKDDKG